MSLTGQLETMPLPDILQFVGLGRKSGVLTVESGTVRKQLIIENGLAVYCSSGNAKEYLGQHLLARTRLSEEDLERAFRQQRETGKKLGEVLVSTGLIGPDELTAVLHDKVEDSMYELFTWQRGRFEFVEGAVSAEDIPVRLSANWQDLVMEGARRADEMAVMRSVIPGSHVKLATQPSRYPEGFPATGGDRKLITLVQEGRNVGEICVAFHVSDFEILKRMVQLVREGVLEVDAVSLEEGRALLPEELLRCGVQLMEKDHHSEALDVFREGISKYPDDLPLAEGQRAAVRRLRKQIQAATADFTAVPVLRVTLEQLTTLPLTSRQAFVATRINGSYDIRSIVQVCPFEEIDVLCTIDGMARQGLIDLRPAGS